MDARPTRRTVLAQGLAAAGAIALGATKPMQDQPIVLGSGSERYQWVPDWLVPPAEIHYGDTHGLAQDSQGRIYLSHTVHPDSTNPDGVCVFDEQGKFLASWGPEFKGGAHGLDIRTEDGTEFIYHCDTNRRTVSKTTLEGQKVWEFGTPKEPGVYDEQRPFVPTNVAFGPDGSFYVADGYGSDWIHWYDKDANWKKTFGGPGTEPGKVRQPHGIWLDDRGKDPMLVVADRANRRLQFLDPEGTHVKFVTEGMRLPCHFSVQAGRLLVPDLQSVVTVLDEEDRVVVSLGDGDPTNLRGRPREEFVPGRFIHPHDAVFLRNGDILVAEWVPVGRVTLLRKLT